MSRRKKLAASEFVTVGVCWCDCGQELEVLNDGVHSFACHGFNEPEFDLKIAKGLPLCGNAGDILYLSEIPKEWFNPARRVDVVH